MGAERRKGSWNGSGRQDALAYDLVPALPPPPPLQPPPSCPPLPLPPVSSPGVCLGAGGPRGERHLPVSDPRGGDKIVRQVLLVLPRVDTHLHCLFCYGGHCAINKYTASVLWLLRHLHTRILYSGHRAINKYTVSVLWLLCILVYYTLTVYFGVVGRHGAINKYNVLAVLYTDGVFWCGG